MTITIKTIESLHSVSASEWNTLAGSQFPFIQHEFLIALENNGAVGKEFGWLALYKIQFLW